MNMSWEYLASAEAHGHSVYLRDGGIYSLPKNHPPLYKGERVEFVLCSGHEQSKWLPGPEQFTETFRCRDCFALTSARNPNVQFRYIHPVGVENLNIREAK